MKLVSAVRSLMVALALALCFAPSSSAQIPLFITIGPPTLPVYEQPVCPGDDYIWTPGYWAWGDDDYYWVPGTWVLAPEPGFLWTPGYWGWRDGAYLFYPGYWGARIGFYGGINYGFGYGGRGYEGGRWDNGHFFYNRSVSNVNETIIKNVYNTAVENNTTINRVSYNGGSGGVEARATTEEAAAERDRHIPPLAAQTQHAEAARNNPQLRASANKGRPPIAATQRPNEFSGHAVVAAKEAGATYHAAVRAGSIRAAAPTPSHAQDIPPALHDAAPNTGDPALDRKYQRQQQDMYTRQDQERQKLQAQQAADHQRMAQQQAADARRQQMEQDHLRQTQQLMQRHAQDIPPALHDAAPNTGDPALDRKYQRQQQDMYTRQDQERQKLQAQQAADHQRMAQQQAADARRQQMEQDHLRQTQQLMQRHAQEQQRMTAAHQQPRPAERKPAQ